MKHSLAAVFVVGFSLCDFTNSTPRPSEFHLEGDYLLGGLFDIHYVTSPLNPKRPEAIDCSSQIFLLPNYRRFQLMRFTVEEINNSTTLLPNVTLGYEIFDHCSDTLSLPGILELISVNGFIQPWPEPSKNRSKVMALVGPFTSTQSVTIAPFFMMDHIPMISYGSSASIFSDKLKYPSFLRTVHPNKDTIDAIVMILQHFNWRWVAFLNSDKDYGIDALEIFTQRIKNTDICMAFTRNLDNSNDYKEILKQIEAQKINVIVVFAPKLYAEAVIKTAVHLNVTNKVWVADDGWALNKVLPNMEGIKNIGTVIGVAQPLITIPGFEEFIKITKSQAPKVDPEQQTLCNQVCNCRNLTTEDILATDPSFSFPVYSAVHAVARALHNVLECEAGRCSDQISVQPYMETYVNVTEDPYQCVGCKKTEWSEAGSTSCKLRLVEYLPFTDIGVILVMVAALILLGLILAISVLFAINFNTPVVRSAGGPMCFLILGCLTLCSLSVFFYFATCSFIILPLLCCLCFIFSYMGKDLPKNYNEAKAITFCLLLLIITWIVFITGYLLYQGLEDASASAHTTGGPEETSNPVPITRSLEEASDSALSMEGPVEKTAPVHVSEGQVDASASVHVPELSEEGVQVDPPVTYWN
ncbi:taste receptor type 1 member 1-like [Fundulus diaphanus]